MGLAPEKASRIKARDTQTTSPDPWSIATCKVATAMDLGSDTDPWCVIIPIGLTGYAGPTHLGSVVITGTAVSRNCN